MFQFSVPLKDKPSVTVSIIPNENNVESLHEAEVSKRMWECLQKGISDGSSLPRKLQSELLQICSGISAVQKVLRLIKYCLNQSGLDERLCSSKGRYWSADKSEWKLLPAILSASLELIYATKLDESSARDIQKYIGDSFEPFLALRHLHKAKQEMIPRYKWIDATIAAELAIKEFFIKDKPHLECLLLEVPSPPLNILYGAILESYSGERSPKLSKIKKGIKIRDELAHRPEDESISHKEANEYVHDIEVAIYHLLTLLYPEDSVVKDMYESLRFQDLAAQRKRG